jgi:hypothetical protein
MLRARHASTPAVRIDDADDDSDALLLDVDPLEENAPDFGVRWCGAWGRCGRLRRLRDIRYEARQCEA